MTLTEAIAARHSVRQYLEKPIETEKIVAIKACVDECNAQSGLHIQVVTNEPTAFQNGLAKYGKFRNVNNYLALVGPKGKQADELTGYYGERVVLLMQTLGLNSCWVVMTFKNVRDAYSIAEDEDLKGVIAFGYGANQGKQHPQKRAIAEVAVNKSGSDYPEWFVRGMESALLAPTAMNQQRFEFVLGEGNKVEAKTRFALNSYTYLDLGIVKYHFEIGAGKEKFIWV